MKATLFVLSVIFLVSTDSSHARIGETVDELRERFGAEVSLHPELNNATAVYGELRSALYFDQDLPDKTMDKWKTTEMKGASFHGFRNGNIFVHVVALYGRSVFECYLRAGPLDENEVKALTSANDDGRKWQVIPNEVDPTSSIVRLKLVSEETGEIDRHAISNGGSNLSFYVPQIVAHILREVAALDAEKVEERKADTKKF